MAKRSTANISLTPELNAFVATRIASGRYQSASEVVREALRLLEEREATRVRTIEDLRREVAIGYAQAKAGQFVDGPAVFRRLRERIIKGQSGKSTRRRAG
jgi:antitoxin ParD1/3/4